MAERDRHGSVFDLGKFLEEGSAENLEKALLRETSRPSTAPAAQAEENPPAGGPEVPSEAPAQGASVEEPEPGGGEPAADDLAAAGERYGPLDQLVARIDRAVARRCLEVSHTASDAAPSRPSSDRFVVFALAGQHLAVPAPTVAEVGDAPRTTAVPGAPSWLPGVANLRGTIFGVVDLRPFLRSPLHRRSSSQMLVLKAREEELDAILLVDKVMGMATLREREAPAPPPAADERLRRCLTGASRHRGHSVALMDVGALLVACEAGWSEFSAGTVPTEGPGGGGGA